jgi:hypothetical protein
MFDTESIFEMKNAVYTVNSLSGDSSYNSYFLKKLREDKGFTRSFLMYHYANFLLRMSPVMADSGIDVLKKILLAEDESNKQVHSFGIGAIERIKEYYEREKAVDDVILSADKKSQIKEKYDLTTIRAEDELLNRVIQHAKAAMKEVKKDDQ